LDGSGTGDGCLLFDDKPYGLRPTGDAVLAIKTNSLALYKCYSD
jgi:hypothetical protein